MVRRARVSETRWRRGSDGEGPRNNGSGKARGTKLAEHCRQRCADRVVQAQQMTPLGGQVSAIWRTCRPKRQALSPSTAPRDRRAARCRQDGSRRPQKTKRSAQGSGLLTCALDQKVRYRQCALVGARQGARRIKAPVHAHRRNAVDLVRLDQLARAGRLGIDLERLQ